MKLFKTVGLIGVLVSGGLVEASEYSHSLRVNVPFAFVVAGQQFAAGQYDVKETENGVITVQGEGKAAAVISTPFEASKPGMTSALQFTGDGSRGDGSRDLVSVAVEGEGRRSVPVHTTQERKLTLAASH